MDGYQATMEANGAQPFGQGPIASRSLTSSQYGSGENYGGYYASDPQTMSEISSSPYSHQLMVPGFDTTPSQFAPVTINPGSSRMAQTYGSYTGNPQIAANHFGQGIYGAQQYASGGAGTAQE